MVARTSPSSAGGRGFGPGFATHHFLLIAEAHNSQVRAGICFPLIAETHIQEANRPDGADIGLRSLWIMRLSDEQQVAAPAEDTSRIVDLPSGGSWAPGRAQAFCGCMNWK
jgi:hypothetical protein